LPIKYYQILGWKKMLFEPISFSGLQLKNRIVRSATYEKRADPDGYVTEPLITFYEELARGGVGLIITGFAMVHPSGRAIERMLSAHSDRYIEGLRKLAGRVHEAGGVIALQIAHGGRQSPAVLLGGQPPMAPSDDPEGPARAMTDTQIWETVDAFGEAARRAQDAGMDAVQIHGAHGYLVSSFLSPRTNRRDDYWGGDEERRFHFAEEVYKAIQKSVGDSYPVLIKMNGDDLFPEGGLKPEESLRIALRLEAAGMDCIEISGGMRESPVKTIRPNILKPSEEAYFRDIGRLFKKHLKIPVILTGGMRSRKIMEDVLRKKDADMVGLSRPLIREPNLPELMRRTGKEKADCISCNKCANFLRLDTVKCVQLLGGGRAQGA
jgi:2,4-dienoyl-CoA reductase-like NADH-dependent reductase (Old Yellow Enzyme family)